MNTPTDRVPNYARRFLILVLAFLLVFFVSFMLGQYPIAPVTLIKILLSRVFEITQTWEGAAETVVFQVRLPRIIGGALIGAALSTAGASYQGVFQNPMVSPDILGASSGAGFGAALGILLSVGYLGISLMSFVFGLGAVLLAYFISRRGRGNAVLSMVLAGIMISTLANSATSFVKLVADTDSVLPAITYWLMGSLASLKQKDVWFLLIPCALGLIPLLLLRWRINLLTTGDEEAASMGINVKRLRGAVILCSTLLAAASVAVSGLIGWVGLVIPHFSRMAFGHDYRRVIPASMLMGAAFLPFVDNFARLLTTSEIPIGILTSFVGAPMFVYLILKGGGSSND